MNRRELLFSPLAFYAAKRSFARSAKRQDASMNDYDQISKGPLRIRELPGRSEFTFTMYGGPFGSLKEMKSLIDFMRSEGLGNGFDPGPSASAANAPLFDFLASIRWPVIAYPPFADMQVMGGRARLKKADRDAFREMDKAGVFHAVQLGEWGYYFHNLSMNEDWFKDVYGGDFDQFKSLMKPKDLRGYAVRPRDRTEAYDAVRRYFMERKEALGGHIISVTGHSHYEAYAGEWGADEIGLEVGENIRFTQSKVAFARGASRRWDKPWSMQVSPWFAGSCTTNGPLTGGPGNARGLDAGHSLSLYERMWLYGWFSGAATVTPENSISSFFEEGKEPWRLTAHGRKAKELFAFMRSHDRGIPCAPIAVVLDHLCGYNGYMDRSWGILDKTASDWLIDDLFKFQLFPGSGESNDQSLPNPEGTYLTPTPYGELCDVLLSDVTPEVLSAYPDILLVGDIEFPPSFLDALKKALRSGSRLLLSVENSRRIGAALSDLRKAGEVEAMSEWINPATGRLAAISDERLRRIRDERFPARVTGKAQYLFNRNREGWILALINNAGILKKGHLPAQVDPGGGIDVRVKPLIPIQAIRDWRTGEKLTLKGGECRVDLSPGGCAFLEIIPDMKSSKEE